MRLRLSAFYAAMFAFVGVQLPFWPVWLQGRGLDAGEIGLVLGTVLCCKVLVNPLIAATADRLRARRGAMVVLALAALAAHGALYLSEGFWSLLALAVLGGVAFAAILPLGEAIGLAVVYARDLDYGRLRLWGSLAFIAAAVGLGHVLAEGDENLILVAMVGLLALVVVAARAMPEGSGAEGAPPAPGAIRALLAKPIFWLFLATAGLNHASHAVLYGFATLHWRQAGIAEGTIGWLWAEGVAAEILLFSLSNRILARLGVANLLLLAAAASAVRWAALAVTTDLAALVAIQALHGLSFGAAHLGAMHFIARAIPANLTATAQSLNTAIAGGVIMAGGIAGAGWLYGAFGGRAFLAMTGLAMISGLLALWLGRRWRDQRI